MQKTVHETIAPVPYQPSYEVLACTQAAHKDDMQQLLRKISATTYIHSAHATRSVAAKSHGLIYAEMEVYDNLPQNLAQGLFANAKTLPLVMRFSTVAGDMRCDKASVPRDLALKIVGVEGERVHGSENETTQDFLLVNTPAFVAASAQQFLNNLELLTQEVTPDLKAMLAHMSHATSQLIENLQSEHALLKSGNPPQVNMLGETYYSQTPIMYGDYMAKIALVPIAPELTALTNMPVDFKFATDELKKSIVDFFIAKTAVWELRVQLCTDISTMPIEGTSAVWSEDVSPYLPVARITAKPQIGWSPYRSRLVDEGMTFSPWHGLKSHRPLGSFMQFRKMTYELSKKLRAKTHGAPVSEPTHLDDLC